MNYLVAALLAAHGFAHLVGFLVSWRLMESAEVPYRTTIFDGAIDLADGGIRVYGVIWLILAGAFCASAMALLSGTASWLRAVMTLAVVSLVLCAAGWPETRFGVLVNAAILAAAFFRSGVR